MDKDRYIALFEELEFFCRDHYGNECPVATAYQAGRVLQHHTGHLPNIYFNGTERDGVSFVVHSQDWDRYPAELWDVFGPRKPTDNNPRNMTLVPKPGMESAAFGSLL